MKLLCLHGTYGSATKFNSQLSLFVDEITRTSTNQFKWIDGGHQVAPPPGFDDFFGPPPHHRFVDFDGIESLNKLSEKLRDFPDGLSAEDTMRRLFEADGFGKGEGVKPALQRLFEIIDADPEIDGILGYSEGASVAATLVLEERRRFEEEGIPRRIKCGVFFGGWPPAKLVDGVARCLLADECEDMIDIPTCHIVGCKDPYIHGSMALYGMCDEDTATLFDHGKGHTIPRDATTVKELAEVVAEAMGRAGVAVGA